MEKICHIYLYGDIINFQADDISYWGCCSLSTIKNAYLLNPDCEEVQVHIHSCGGDLFEALAMYDYLISLKNKGKKITTVIEGLCASAATIVLLAGDDRLMTENSRFLIHNPMSWAEGTAAEIGRVASFLVDEQEKLVEFYVAKTGGDAEQLQGIMDEDKFVDADTALELKFITQVIETVTALAKVQNRLHQQKIFNSINQKKMNAQKKTKSKGIIANLKALIKTFGEEAEVTNTTVDLDNGTTIYFAEDTLAEGIEVFSDEAMTEALADGDYLYNDGDTITVADGKVSAITPKTDNETDAQAVTRLTAENKVLKASLVEAETLVDELTNSLTEAQTVLNTVSTNWKPTARATQPNKPAASAAKKVENKVEPKKGDLKASVAEEKERRKAATKK